MTSQKLVSSARETWFNLPTNLARQHLDLNRNPLFLFLDNEYIPAPPFLFLGLCLVPDPRARRRTFFFFFFFLLPLLLRLSSFGCCPRAAWKDGGRVTPLAVELQPSRPRRTTHRPDAAPFLVFFPLGRQGCLLAAHGEWMACYWVTVRPGQAVKIK